MARRARECEECHSVFDANPKLSKAQWAGTTTCSRSCRDRRASRLRCAARPELQEVFDAGYGVEPLSECWVWKGTINSDGYGVFRWRGASYRAHVVSLQLAGRPVPTGMVACHRCDNPPCVNPSHLYVGSAATNAKDAKERSLLRAGESHPAAKLDELTVRWVRSIGWNNSRTARWIGVSRSTVASIRSRRTWDHVT